jgi:putative transposase
MLSVVVDEQARLEFALDLDELVLQGARRMLAAALEAEVAAYIEAHAQEQDERGHRLVRRNGHARERTVATGAGPIPVAAPRVDDRRLDPVTGEKASFTSAILPPWCRKSPKVSEVLPLLYLHGLSSSDFVPALEAFFGSAAGLSASVVTRLTAQWQAEREAFMARCLVDRDYVYIWADGVHFNVRLADGYRESTDSWAEVLRDLRRRGMGAPVVAVGDGALGLWAALGEVFPETRPQRCWVHKAANVLAAMPKSVHAGVRRALAEIRDAEDRDHALAAIQAFARDYGSKWPKAVAKVADDAEALLTFYDFPAEHWLHLKTTNPVESTFSTVRLRTRVTKGPGSKQAGLAMAFKLLEAAEDRWRSLNGPHLVALVRAGARFDKGVMVERPNDVQEVAA